MFITTKLNPCIKQQTITAERHKANNMAQVKSVKHNWRQVGSIQGIDSAGEDYEIYTVGFKGVVSIQENEPTNVNQVWNYVVTFEDGSSFRLFNPNFVEYFK